MGFMQKISGQQVTAPTNTPLVSINTHNKTLSSSWESVMGTVSLDLGETMTDFRQKMVMLDTSIMGFMRKTEREKSKVHELEIHELGLFRANSNS